MTPELLNEQVLKLIQITKINPPNLAAEMKVSDIIQGLHDAHLSATTIDILEAGGFVIKWQSSYNEGYQAQITCYNNGVVTAYTWNPDIQHSWVVTDKKHDNHNLTIPETMERIRHHIWANHDAL